MGASMFSSIGFQLGIGVACCVIFELGATGFRRFRKRLRQLSANHLWAPLIADDIDIVMSEFSNQPAVDDPQIRLVRNIGINHFLSKGVAQAVAEIIFFLGKEFNFFTCARHGDKTLHKELRANLVLIGSPVTNRYTASVFRQIKETYDTGFDIEHDDAKIRIVDTVANKVFETELDGEIGVDYALVVRARISVSPPRHCLLLCGASMWGVEGAAQIITSSRGLRKISRMLASHNSLAFLVKVSVIGEAAHNPEIVALEDGHNRRFVRVLKPRTAK
jgi:hypothetical protein